MFTIEHDNSIKIDNKNDNENIDINSNKMKIKQIENNQVSITNGNFNHVEDNGDYRSNSIEFENELLWFNTNQLQISNTNIYKFQKLIEEKHKLKFG